MNLSNTLGFKKHRTEIKYSLKKERAFNRLREDTTPENSGNRTLYSNRWVNRVTLLQNILDNWAVFQELWDGILEGKVDSEIRGQVIGVQKQMQNFNFFLECNWEFFYSAMHTRHVIKLSQLQKYVFQPCKV